MRLTRLALLLAGLLGIGVSSPAIAQRTDDGPPSVSYDSIGPLSVQERLRVFGEISPENRAAIVRTHLERWIAANRDRLTPDQLGILEEIFAFVKSDLYRPIFETRTERRADELEARAAALFSPEDVVQALTVRGAYIPPEGSGR